MKPLLLVIFILLTTPLAAQQAAPRTVDDAVARIDQIFTNPSTDNPEEEVYTMLGDALRQARRGGYLTRDWAIVYAMLTDGARNVLRNPSYALQLANEGLALIGGDPDQWDYRAILRVTRAYALADLGRLDDAVQAAKLAMPDYEKLWDDDKAEELKADAAQWEAGGLTTFNTPATELAGQALDRAEEALDRGAWARVVTLASTALLPEDSGFSALELARINARAEYLAARGLTGLSRFDEAGNALLRALDHMAEDSWQLGQPIVFKAGDPLPDADARQARQILLWLANVAMRLERTDIAEFALTEAERHITDVNDRTTLLTLRASILWRGNDHQRAIALLEDTRQAALFANDLASAAMAGFYVQTARASLARGAGEMPDIGAISQATDHAISHLPKAQHGFVFLEAARALRGSDAHGNRLDYARAALDAARDEIAGSGETGFGEAAARAGVRSTVEELLNASHAKLSDEPDGLTAQCPDETDIYGCALFRGLSR